MGLGLPYIVDTVFKVIKRAGQTFRACGEQDRGLSEWSSIIGWISRHKMIFKPQFEFSINYIQFKNIILRFFSKKKKKAKKKLIKN
jgi:hypothetical protein